MWFPLTQKYIVDWLQETAWALVIGAATVALPIILATDIEMVEDWKLWAAGLGVAVARVAIAVGVNQVRRLLGLVGEPPTP